MNPTVRNNLNVTLLLGGPSAEREVSLLTGSAVAETLTSIGHRVTCVDPSPGALRVPEGTDVVFVALHGTYGEDGQVQSELEAAGVAYTGSGVEASRLAFDKMESKRRFVEHRIPTANHAVVTRRDDPHPAHLHFPLVLKPVRQGSSVGLEFVRGAEEWAGALQRTLEHGDEILVEERIMGREVTVAVLGGQVLPIVEVRPADGRYDYQNKYHSGTTQYLCPAPFTESETTVIQRVGLQAFLSVGARDYGRVDAIIRPDGEPVLLEVNTLPGMTATSLLPKAAAAAGISYADLCQRMLELALEHSPCPH